MKMMRPIAVTPDNHAAFDTDAESGTRQFDVSTTAMNDLNAALSETLGEGPDWAAIYANWLEGLGIGHQSDNGWWSLAAINPDNIKCFIEDYTDDQGDWSAMCDRAREIIGIVKLAGRFRASGSSARRVIELLGRRNDSAS